MKKSKKYVLRYYSKLGCRRKPSVTELLREQKEKFIFNFRKKRERSRRAVNVIYFDDIDKYAVICGTLINNSDTSIDVVILDDDDFLDELDIATNNDAKRATVHFADVYEKYEWERPEWMTLEYVNAVRESIKTSMPSSYSWMEPLKTLPDTYIEYVTIPRGRI